MDSIIFSGVGKRYRSLWALRDVDATFRQGEVVLVIGPNGSGKTTLIKCLLGLVRPTTGSIRVEGQVIGPDPGYRRSIGYMPQISQFPPSLTIGQLLDMMRDARGLTPASADDGLVEELGLASPAEQAPGCSFRRHHAEGERRAGLPIAAARMLAETAVACPGSVI